MTASLREREVQGVRVPTFIYGTAWKEEKTAHLTALALRAGFRAIDTANQRRHYHEAGVGEAIQQAFASGLVSRSHLFLQTKFTFQRGQDGRLPYDPRAPIATQVERSFASSLDHLGVDGLDAYLLHGPSRAEGLIDDDWEAWRAMEVIQRDGRARLIGVSNVTAGQLSELHTRARVAPALVQNRCFARPKADGAVRAFCQSNGIAYQGFSLLTAARPLTSHPALREVAQRAGLTPEQAVFRFVLERGLIALTGTASALHMEHDLAVFDHPLNPEAGAMIAGLIGW